MSKKTKQKLAEQDATREAIESAIGKTEMYIKDNGKILLAALAAVIAVVGIFFGYKYLYAQPRENNAADMLYVAEQWFARGEYELALNGDGNNPGFLDVIRRYGSTASGNIANHYAGICYIYLFDMSGAAQYLKAYKPVRGIPGGIINAQNIGLQGDIFSEQGDLEKAAAKYMEAVKLSSNGLTAPYYLKKAGITYMLAGKNDAAVAAFQAILYDYPSSVEAEDADKFIGAAQQN